MDPLSLDIVPVVGEKFDEVPFCIALVIFVDPVSILSEAAHNLQMNLNFLDDFVGFIFICFFTFPFFDGTNP